MNFRGLAAAVVGVPPPPCEAFHCKHKERCGAEQLACNVFRDYVRTGVAAPPRGLPTKLKYAATMREEDHPQTGCRNGTEVCSA